MGGAQWFEKIYILKTNTKQSKYLLECGCKVSLQALCNEIDQYRPSNTYLAWKENNLGN